MCFNILLLLLYVILLTALLRYAFLSFFCHLVFLHHTTRYCVTFTDTSFLFFCCSPSFTWNVAMPLSSNLSAYMLCLCTCVCIPLQRRHREGSGPRVFLRQSIRLSFLSLSSFLTRLSPSSSSLLYLVSSSLCINCLFQISCFFLVFLSLFSASPCPFCFSRCSGCALRSSSEAWL